MRRPGTVLRSVHFMERTIDRFYGRPRAFLTFIYIVSIVFEVVLAFLFGEQAPGFQQELL